MKNRAVKMTVLSAVAALSLSFGSVAMAAPGPGGGGPSGGSFSSDSGPSGGSDMGGGPSGGSFSSDNGPSGGSDMGGGPGGNSSNFSKKDNSSSDSSKNSNDSSNKPDNNGQAPADNNGQLPPDLNGQAPTDNNGQAPADNNGQLPPDLNGQAPNGQNMSDSNNGPFEQTMAKINAMEDSDEKTALLEKAAASMTARDAFMEALEEAGLLEDMSEAPDGQNMNGQAPTDSDFDPFEDILEKINAMEDSETKTKLLELANSSTTTREEFFEALEEAGLLEDLPEATNGQNMNGQAPNGQAPNGQAPTTEQATEQTT